MKRRLILKATQLYVEDVRVIPQNSQAPHNRTPIKDHHNLNDPELDQQLNERQHKKHTGKLMMMPQTKPYLYLAETYLQVLDH
jgi:hypothetical protein